MDQEFDVIVVGSGVSGGWAAKEMCEKGFKTLLIDRGKMVEHRSYENENLPPYQMDYRGQVPPETVESDYFISQYGHLTGWTAPFYNNDRLNPYDYEGSKPFHWIRSAVFGGKSLLWGRWVLRWSDLDFEANKKDGHGNDWPLRYADVQPWYDYVERYIGVAGSEQGLPHLPDSVFMPPHEMNVAERWIAENLERAYDGKRRLIHGRTTNITEPKPEQGRAACQRRRWCDRGCSFGAYFSTQAVTLPAARKTGNLTIITDHVVSSLDYDPATQRVSAVNTIDANDKSPRRFTGRCVFLCASTVGSVQIMLNSRSETFPTGIANGSDTLGRYVMDHFFRVLAFGTVPGFHDKREFGRRPTGVYIPRFRNLGDAETEQAEFVRGYGYQGGSGRNPVDEAEGFGVELKQSMRRLADWGFGMTAFGECLPYRDNTISLHPTETDRFGVPLVRFDVTYRQNEHAMIRDAHAQGIEMLQKAGLSDVGGESNIDDQTPGRAIHEMGGARMGTDPTDSVLNRWSQAHTVPNLFVTDGAQFSSQSCVNPSLTFMALTARAADFAAGQLREGVI